MRNRKQVVVSLGSWLAVALLVTLPALAQPQGRDREQMERQGVEELKERLQLTDEQSQQVEPILKDGATQMHEMRERLRDSGRSREAMQSMREESQKLAKETRAKLEAVLSAEQLETYDALIEERREEHQKRMRDHRQGGSGTNL